MLDQFKIIKIKFFTLPSLFHFSMFFISICRLKFLTHVIFFLTKEFFTFLARQTDVLTINFLNFSLFDICWFFSSFSFSLIIRTEWQLRSFGP